MAQDRQELHDQSLGELVQRLSDQTSELVRREIRLAQSEPQQKGKRAGIGAGMFGGAGVAGLYAAGAIVAALILLLATAMEPWLAALIVGVVLAAVAGVLALVGKKQVEQAVPPAPEQAVESVKQDVDEVKARARG